MCAQNYNAKIDNMFFIEQAKSITSRNINMVYPPKSNANGLKLFLILFLQVQHHLYILYRYLVLLIIPKK